MLLKNLTEEYLKNRAHFKKVINWSLTRYTLKKILRNFNLVCRVFVDLMIKTVFLLNLSNKCISESALALK